MEFKIIKNPSYTDSIDIGLELSPDNEVLRLFLATIGKKYLSKFLASVSDSVGFAIENASLSFFYELDWEDIESLNLQGGIQEGQICIFLYDGSNNETILDEILLRSILVEYMEAFIETYTHELEDQIIQELREIMGKLLK